MKKTFGAILIAIFLLFAMSMASTCLAAESITMKFATFLPPQSFIGKHHQWWADEVEKRTDGKLKFKIFWMGSLAKHDDMLDSVQSGIADLGLYSFMYNPKTFPLSLLMDLPYNVGDDWEAAMKASMETQRKEPNLKAELEKAGVITVIPHVGGPYVFVMKKCPDSISAMKGKTIRMIGGGRVRWAEMLGLNPVTLSLADVYEGIDRGTIDGADLAFEMSHIHKHYEITKCAMDLKSGNVLAAGTIMNLKAYNKLPKDVQDVLEQMVSEYIDRYGKALKGLVSTVHEKWEKEYGVSFYKMTAEEDRTLREAGQKVTEEFIKSLEREGLPAQKVWDYFRSSLKKYEK